MAFLLGSSIPDTTLHKFWENRIWVVSRRCISLAVVVTCGYGRAQPWAFPKNKGAYDKSVVESRTLVLVGNIPPPPKP